MATRNVRPIVLNDRDVHANASDARHDEFYEDHWKLLTSRHLPKGYLKNKSFRILAPDEDASHAHHHDISDNRLFALSHLNFNTLTASMKR
jgi:hypothetical protein